MDSKDSKIKALDKELAKMRGKLEKTLSKMYLPSQDEVVEGLAGDILERGELNIMAKAGGHQQEFELSQTVNQGGDMSEGIIGMDEVAQPGSAEANKKWAQELAKADERGNRFRLQLEEVQRRKAEVEDKLQSFEKHVLMREEEIKRLHQLYEGGSNLEALSVKHTHETNERTIGKLANQVDFLNKENHQLQQQVHVLKGDRKVVKTIDNYEKEIQNLQFELECTRKDLAESAKVIREYQDREVFQQRRDEELQQ